jgi:hypothetical protein
MKHSRRATVGAWARLEEWVARVTGALRSLSARGCFEARATYTNPPGDRHTGEVRKYFFFEKKKQKTFAYLVNAAASSSVRAKRIKVFWFFFSKKNCFLGACLRLPRTTKSAFL